MSKVQIKDRNMWLQILLVIVTFGLYTFYWFYQTATELKSVAADEQASPGLWTVLLFIPFLNIYSWYKYAELFEQTSSEKLNRWILILLWIVLVPAVWFLVQTDLNKKARVQVAI